MTYSKTLEDIPKARLEDLATFLSEIRSSKAKATRVSTAAEETGVDVATTQVIFSELVNENVLRAKLEIRCPYCDTQHGYFSRMSEVPDERKQCFVCGNEFSMDSQSNWEVVYEIEDESADFFPDEGWHIKKYLKSGEDLPPSFFRDELERLRALDDEPQKRGREFDYFIGLLFHQLGGVEVRSKDNTKTGEVDVYVSCLKAEGWLRRLVGHGTLLENKWQKNPVEKGEVDNFHSKAQDLAFPCYLAYFVSISGFSTGKGNMTGAIATLRNTEDPRIVDLNEEDVIEMVDKGTPESKLRERELV